MNTVPIDPCAPLIRATGAGTWALTVSVLRITCSAFLLSLTVSITVEKVSELITGAVRVPVGTLPIAPVKPEGVAH